MRKAKICVIVPAFNEERVIKSSLTCLKRVVARHNIFVVSDGSKDKTVCLARKAGVKTLALKKNYGKAKAIFKLIKKFDLTKHYQYILFSDADSRLEKNFLSVIKPIIYQKPACIVGTVKSDRQGLISAFRTYEYGFSHLIFKNAQNATKTLAIAPGCASLYRSDVLEKLNFQNGPLTEDFDLTLQIHQQKLGKVVYVSKATVITQDPLTLKDYWQQVLRWNTGFWQNIFLHRLYLPTKKINLEVMLLALDVLAILLGLYYCSQHPNLFINLLGAMLIFTIFFAILILVILRQFWAILYAPLFPLFYLINLTAYFTSFFRALIGIRRVLGWRKVARY